MKKAIVSIFSLILFLTVISLPVSAAEYNGECAVWVPETQIIHINSLLIPSYNDEGERVGEVYFWADFRLVANPLGEEGLFFELCLDYGYSEQADDNCSAWDLETQTIHISSLLSGETCYWADLFFRSELGLFQFTDWCHHGLKTFGPAFNGVVGFGNWQENLEETSQFSNLAMIASDGNSVIGIAFRDAQKIKKATELGMKSLVVITGILFVADFDESGVLKDVRFRDNYHQRLAEYKFWLRIFGVKLEDIWGFYVMDEPYSAAIIIGMPIEQMRRILNEAIATLKEVFPSSKTVNVIGITREDLEQGGNDWQEYAFPNFDIVGVYCYWTQYKIFYPESTLEDFKKEFHEKYMGNANQFLLPGQKIVLVPGTFGFTHSDMPTMEDFLKLAKFYGDTAKSDPRITAVVPFLWPSSGDLIGLRELSPKVPEAWREIGKKILGNARE